jgi:hypothetical protein
VHRTAQHRQRGHHSPTRGASRAPI